MLKMPKNTINLVGMMEITELSVGIRNAAIYVGLDTAVTHLAAMIGTPTVALFGPSNPRKWGPWPKGYNSQIGSSPWSIKGSQRNNRPTTRAHKKPIVRSVVLKALIFPDLSSSGLVHSVGCRFLLRRRSWRRLHLL